MADSNGEIVLGPPRGPIWRKVVWGIPRVADAHFVGSLISRLAAWSKGRWDTSALLRECPWLTDYPLDSRVCARELASLHEEYVTTISKWGMAVSLELAVFLLVACRRLRPARVMDLGSGFSSLVLRIYAGEAADPRTHVVSVDDDEAWLEKTRSYLAAQKRKEYDLMTWRKFSATPSESFDLVLVDLGKKELRERIFPEFIGHVAPGGCLIVDDAHDAPYRGLVKRLLGERGWKSFSIRPYTCDKVGRYSYLAFAPKDA